MSLKRMRVVQKGSKRGWVEERREGVGGGEGGGVGGGDDFGDNDVFEFLNIHTGWDEGPTTC